MRCIHQRRIPMKYLSRVMLYIQHPEADEHDEDNNLFKCQQLQEYAKQSSKNLLKGWTTPRAAMLSISHNGISRLTNFSAVIPKSVGIRHRKQLLTVASTSKILC